MGGKGRPPLFQRLLFAAADLTCQPNHLPCPGGFRSCVYYAWLCDGDADCRDNSDETAEVCQNHGRSKFPVYNHAMLC